jgi:Spy/CpxP family protein refolding chaperone
MSPPTDPLAEPAADKPIPLWVALSVMGAIVLVGSGLIWRYLYRPATPTNAVSTIIPSPSNPRVAGGPEADPALKSAVLKAAAEADLPDGVHALGADDILFKAGDAYLKVRRHDDGQPAYSFGSFALPDLEWQHGYLTQGVRRIVSQDDFAKELGVTDAQRKALADLPDPPAGKWPQADRDRFVALYKVWDKATGDAKAKAATDLVEALRAYADPKRAADQKAMSDRVGRITSILTPEQVTRINPIPRWDLK